MICNIEMIYLFVISHTIHFLYITASGQCFYAVIISAFLDFASNFIVMSLRSALHFVTFVSFINNGSSGIAEINRVIFKDVETYKKCLLRKYNGNLFQFLMGEFEHCYGTKVGYCSQHRYRHHNHIIDWSEVDDELFTLISKSFYCGETSNWGKAKQKSMQNGIKILLDGLTQSSKFSGAGPFNSQTFVHLSALLGIIPLYCVTHAEVAGTNVGPYLLIQKCCQDDARLREEVMKIRELESKNKQRPEKITVTQCKGRKPKPRPKSGGRKKQVNKSNRPMTHVDLLDTDDEDCSSNHGVKRLKRLTIVESEEESSIDEVDIIEHMMEVLHLSLSEANAIFRNVFNDFKEIWGTQLTLELYENLLCELMRALKKTISVNKLKMENVNVSILLDSSLYQSSGTFDVIVEDEARGCVQSFFSISFSGKKVSVCRPVLRMKYFRSSEDGEFSDRSEILTLTNWINGYRQEQNLIEWSHEPSKRTLDDTELNITDSLKSILEMDN